MNPVVIKYFVGFFKSKTASSTFSLFVKLLIKWVVYGIFSLHLHPNIKYFVTRIKQLMYLFCVTEFSL